MYRTLFEKGRIHLTAYLAAANTPTGGADPVLVTETTEGH
jgi:hypothetical protein